MTSPPLLKCIQLEGFLSFGYGAKPVPLTALNVVVGPNGSGKSNLVEAVAVLRAIPRDLQLPIRQGGGVRAWIWKGSASGSVLADGSGFGGGVGYGTVFGDGSGAGCPAAYLELVFSEGHVARFAKGDPAVRYRLVFGAQGDTFVVLDERLENAEPAPGETRPYFYFGHEHGRPTLNVSGKPRGLQRDTLDPTQSVLSQRKDPEAYPELSKLAEILARIRIYRNWHFGPDAAVRSACRADARTDHLSETFDNLPARLSALKGSPKVKNRMLELLGELSPGFDDLEVIPEGGTLNLYLTEGSNTIQARRLSDGTLRFLCLLAILVDPQPPPLVVIEEPELGMHPDILPILRDLMIEASTRCQLLVTTHSPQFVDAMSDHADSVLICEKQGGCTVLTRLSPGQVEHLGEGRGLGKLWMEGHLGGTRW